MKENFVSFLAGYFMSEKVFPVFLHGIYVALIVVGYLTGLHGWLL